MNCDRVRQDLHDNPGTVRRILIWLHLLRCPACRAEARQIRALDAALSHLPRFSPPPDLVPNLLARARASEPGRRARKETKLMRRIAYAAASLVVIGLVAGGLLTKSGPPAGRGLLLGVAEAMQAGDTVHARVFGGIAGYYPAIRINNDYEEYWFSPQGFRRDSNHEDGTLWRRLAGNVAQGLVRMDLPTGPAAPSAGGAAGAGGGGMAATSLPTKGVSIEYHVNPSDLAAFVEHSRKQFVNADLRLAQIEELGHEWRSRTVERDGNTVVVIEEDLGLDLVDGRPRGTVYYYVDPATRQLIALEQYGPEDEGRPLLAKIDDIEYGLGIPESTFAPAPDQPEEVVEGTFEVRESGYIVFHGMGYAPNLDPRATTLFDRAQEVRHWVTMSVLPWEHMENAYLAVLDEDPEHAAAREYLGRIYTRWGRYEEALSTLPEVKCSVWSPLNRAFCLDALGKREEALAIYDRLKHVPHDSVAAWAQLGLQQPTWPTDLPIEPEPGENRLKPTRAWHASALHSAFHGEPHFALDGDRATRWASGGDPAPHTPYGQIPGQWFLLDFGAPTRVSRVVLDHHGLYTFYTNDWPRSLQASATADGQTWRPVEVSPGGPNQPATVHFDPPQTVQAVKFQLTKTHAPEWWSVYEVFVFGPTR
jgi:tetratricopeptide (TPR) repeat protein